MRKYVKTHGYFPKPKEVREQKRLGTSDLTYSNKYFSERFPLKDTIYEFFMSPFHVTFPDSLAILYLMNQTILETTFLPDSPEFNSGTRRSKMSNVMMFRSITWIKHTCLENQNVSWLLSLKGQV
jgi:hypothetical protein